MENDADDVKPSFRGALDHLAYAPPNGAPPLTSGSSASTSTSSSTLSPRHHPRRIRATTSAPDKPPKRARSPDVQKSDVQRHSRDGGRRARRHSKFFVQVQAPAAPPSFKNNDNDNKKRKRDRGGGEKEVRIRPRKGRAQKRQKMSGPEAPAPGSDVADVDADGRASPVMVVERFLPDYVAMNLDVLFCGFNPGLTSAAEGHHYANSSNHSWPCLHLSGFTPILLPASEDYTLPEHYNLGLTNLLDNSTPSVSGLSRREMAGAAPGLLAKVARFRPRVACFIGKGIWVHVEPLLLRLQTQQNTDRDPDDSGHNDADGGLVARATESCVTLKKEEMGDSAMACASSSSSSAAVIVTAGDNTEARSGKTGLEPQAVDLFSAMSDPVRFGTESRGSDLSRGHLLTVLKADETSDNPTSSSVTARKRRGVIASGSRASSKKAAAAPSMFAYGLQPYKAVHDAVIKKESGNVVRETLLCVFPSTSGRVVTHQRDDKVALFKTLRRDLERIKAETFDTSSMQLVRLPK